MRKNIRQSLFLVKMEIGDASQEDGLTNASNISKETKESNKLGLSCAKLRLRLNFVSFLPEAKS